MKLYLHGHEYKYAVEQMLLTLFPEERPEYPEGRPAGERIETRLSHGAEYTTATCTLRFEGAVGLGRAAAPNGSIGSGPAGESACQGLIKTAIYRAYLNSGKSPLPWGSLCGVRPGKVLRQVLSVEPDERRALRRFRQDYGVSPRRAELCLDAARQTLLAEASLEERDICLYVGIPFCPTRCSYCSFVSQSVEKSMKLIEPFLQALFQELHATAEQVRELGLRVISVYMGGGTPTTLNPEQLDRLCSLIEKEFDLAAVREYTVEAGRPDTITTEKLRVLKAHGVDRVSVNPQTMSDSVLAAIGRKHSARDVLTALDKVRAIGGFAVNMDLIAGLPSDSVAGFRDTVDRVLTLAPENITIHTLSLKKGSRIMLEGSVIPTAAEVGAMLDYGAEKLRQAQYSPYYLYRQKFMSGGFENVGWTRAGYENIYNICIMEELCSIIALGGGGSTKLIRHDGGRNIRLMAPKYPLEYINQIEDTCADKKKIAEFYNSFLYKEKYNGI